MGHREPTQREIDELGLVRATGWTRCSDSQCGDSTWDHDCDEKEQHRWTTRWVLDE